MEPIGARLKKIRLEKGISLDEVHKKTKIHLNILNAIEEDRIINLSPIYVEGFLKIYCKFLGVDFKDHASIPKETQKAAALTGRTIQIPGPSRPASSLKHAPVKMIPLNIDWNKARFVLIVSFIFAFVFLGLFNLGKAVSQKRKAVSRKTKPTPVASAPAVKPEAKVEAPRKEEEKAPVSAMIRLGVRAREDCWIQLKTDGKVVFQNILKKGRSESWQAKEKIELSLGNAAGVDLEVNGKLISSLGKRGQLIKNILITKEGLTIKR